MIPAQAVDAALKWLRGPVAVAFHDEDLVRQILEAAVPYMLAGAWDEGMEAMYASTSHEWPPIPEQNPYRSTNGDD